MVQNVILFCPCLELMYPAEKRTLPIFHCVIVKFPFLFFVVFFFSVVAEALERLLFMRFIYDSKQKFPVNLERFSVEVNGKVDESLLAEAEMLFCSYEAYHEQARNGSLRKTAQFQILYLDMM